MSRTSHRNPVVVARNKRLRAGAPAAGRPATPRMTRDRDYVSSAEPPANVGDPGAFAAWAAVRYPAERKARKRAAEQKVRGRRKARRAAARASM